MRDLVKIPMSVNLLPSRQNTVEYVLVFSDSILKILFTAIKIFKL